MLSFLILILFVANVETRSLVVNFDKSDFYDNQNPNEVNNRPIIGILAQKSSEEYAYYGDTYFYASYVKFVEGSGARAAPIRVGEPDSYYIDLLSKINGVIFPGGEVDPILSDYSKTVKFIVRYAIKAHDKGDYFPLLGICLGFQTLAVTMVGENILSAVDAENDPLPLEFSNGYSHSKLFGHLPSSLHVILKTENVTPNAHHWGLTPKAFDSKPVLQKFYHVLSTNKDRNGVEFISSMEGFKYPIYGLQFHPEKNTYTFDPKYPWLHSYDAVKVTQYFGAFFISECRKSMHHFPDLQSEYNATIGHITPHALKVNEYPFEELYAFNYTSKDAANS